MQAFHPAPAPTPEPVDPFDRDLAALRLHWTEAHSLTRRDAALAPSSLESHVKRVLQYRRWLEARDGAGPVQSLAELVADLKPFTAFLDASASELQTTEGTRARLCDAMIVVLKCIHAPVDESSPPEAITALRAIRSDLQRRYEVALKARSSTEALQEAGRWATWPQLVASARWLSDEARSLLRVYRREQAGGDAAFAPMGHGRNGDLAPLAERTAKACTDALLALLYTVIPPARGLEYSTLQWGVDATEACTAGRDNLLCVGPSGATLKLSAFKTKAQMGTQA